MTTPAINRTIAAALRRAADHLDPTFVPTPRNPGLFSREDRVRAVEAMRDHADQLDRIAEALGRNWTEAVR